MILDKAKLNKKDSNKHIEIKNINLDGVTVDDVILKKDKSNYTEFINLKNLLENVSSCQISDAFNNAFRRSGVLSNLKPINDKKAYGRIVTAYTNSDDWGTSTLAIDEGSNGDILFIESSDNDNAIWGELASTNARENGIVATAVYGSVRDLDALKHGDYPIFACSFVSNAGTPLGLGEVNIKLNIENMVISPGDFFFGDETGVVIIPQSLFNEVMVQTLAVKLKEETIINMLKEGKSLSEITKIKQ